MQWSAPSSSSTHSNMDLQAPPVFLRQDSFTRCEQPVTPLLTPAIPTHLTLSTTRLPLRQIRLSRGLRRHEIAITHKTSTLFITPACEMTAFKHFITTLTLCTISPPNYLFTALLARGAFGCVHAAISEQQNDLAIKRVPLSNPLWRTERNIVRYLPSHKNIIPVIETFTTRKYLYIVMPLLQPLSSISQPSVQSCLQIIRSLLCAVAHLHKFGICHNDIKPDNILLSSDQQAILTDFGLSSFGPGKGGTHAFHAPYGKGPSADVWSVGVVAFILLTGAMPWEDIRERGIAVRRMREGKDVIGELCEGLNIDEDVLGLLKGLLQVDPRKRLSARAALEHCVFGGHVRSLDRGCIRRLFKGVLCGIRWLESLRGSPAGGVGKTLLL